jgi:hypothetical protein
MATTVIRSFGDLLAYLGEQNVPHAINAEQQIVEIPTKAPPLGGVVYLRWERDTPYVQVIKPLGLDVPAERIGDLETALCRVNNALVLPGFGFDYERHTLYFRLTLPVFPEGMDTTHLRGVLLSCVQSARDFIVPFAGVLAGTSPGSEILTAALAYQQQHQTAQGQVD